MLAQEVTVTELVFTSSTRRFWLQLFPLAVAFVAVQFRLSQWAMTVFPWATEASMRLALGYGPLAVAAIVLLLVTRVYCLGAGWTFEFRAQGLTVRHWRREVRLEWHHVYVTRGRSQALLSDGTNSFRLDAFFHPQLERLCELAEKAHRHARRMARR